MSLDAWIQKFEAIISTIFSSQYSNAQNTQHRWESIFRPKSGQPIRVLVEGERLLQSVIYEGKFTHYTNLRPEMLKKFYNQSQIPSAEGPYQTYKG